jgi:hypothetical protein
MATKAFTTMKDGTQRKYTPPTVDWRKVIDKVRDLYHTNFEAQGVHEITIRNMHYALMDYPELKLGVLADRYGKLSNALVKSRNGDYGEAYRLPEEWFVDMKRAEVEKRPWRTPQLFVDDLMVRIKSSVHYYPQPKFFRQDQYYIELWVEKDTMQRLLEQLVANMIGMGLISVVPVSGYDGHSHLYTHFERLGFQERLGRKIVIFYLGDYDPSGLDIQRDFEDRLSNWGLRNFEVKRVGVTLEQIKRLGLHEVVDPDKLEKLRKDPRGPAFEQMPGHNGRRLAVEVDAFSAPAGMSELKRIMREEILVPPYYNKKIWKKYEDVFTVDKVRDRLLLAVGKWITYETSSSDIEDAIREAFGEDLKSEVDELREIEGKDYTPIVKEEEE